MLPFLGILAIQKTSFFQHVAMRCHSPVFTSLGFYALHSLRTIPSVSRSQPERATVTILQTIPANTNSTQGTATLLPKAL